MSGRNGLPETMPQPASPADYDAVGRAYLDSRYTEWFTSPSCTVGEYLLPASAGVVGEAPRILVPADGSRLALDPELPGGGRWLKLRSNLPAGAVWSSPTLTVVQYGEEASVLLEQERCASLPLRRVRQPGAAFVNYRQGTVTRNGSFPPVHVEKAFRSVQRQDGGDQHLEPFLRNDE